MGFLKKITILAKNQKTYQVGLLQTKAYRVLKQRTAELLKTSDISTVEWAMLGILYDNSQGIRLNILADELGVEAPFVTKMMRKLLKNNLINLIADPEDSRAKVVCLTKQGKSFVEKTELYISKKMKNTFKDISKGDLLRYVLVLQTIVDSTQE